MKDVKIIYIRYNRNRAEKFQTLTQIAEINEKKFVIKKSLTKVGKEHVNSYEKKYQMAKQLYKDIVPLEGNFSDEEVVFPFIEGKSMRDTLSQHKTDKEKLYELLNEYLSVLLSFNEDKIIQYRPTEKCVQVFGDNFAEGKAVEYADIDTIFDNIKLRDDKWIAYDYEWLLDFPIPVDFIKWRILYRYYCAEYEFFKNSTDLYGFMSFFGFDKDITDDYESKEIHFLSYVFGDRYNYIDKYKKSVVDLAYLDRKYGNLDKYIHRVEQANTKLEQDNAVLKDESVFYKNAYETVLNSLSWKVTKPLRTIISKLKHEEV